jgi:hypothetical protein
MREIIPVTPAMVGLSAHGLANSEDHLRAVRPHRMRAKPLCESPHSTKRSIVCASTGH